MLELLQATLAQLEINQTLKTLTADSTEIQTLIFDKKKFKSSKECTKWASDHKFKSGKVDETGNSFRLRQKDPGSFKDGTLKTITITDGIKAVVGVPK